MELQIDASSAVPIYRQVVERIRSLVARRALRPGDRVPSVRELAGSLRINRNTAAKAYAVLETEGILRGRAGEGTFVAADAPMADDGEVRRRLDAAVDRLIADAHDLGVPVEEIAAVLERRLQNVEPVSIEASSGHLGTRERSESRAAARADPPARAKESGR